jgi:predicted translin family RNA/ssDNA-binding protein
VVRTGRLTQEVEKLRGEIVKLSEEIARISGGLIKLSANVETLVGELAGLRSEANRLVIEVERLGDEVRSLKRYLLLAILVYVAFWSTIVAIIIFAHRFLFGG